MHKNKQSESKIVPWQQAIKRYQETRLVRNNEYKIYHMHIKEQDKYRTIFIKHNNRLSKEKTHM